jgi:chromate transporter
MCHEAALDQRARVDDGIAATNLLPGPTSTQLAIFCTWRLRGWKGGLLGGVCLIVPGLIGILALSVLLLSGTPSRPVLGAAAGAGAAVAAVAVQAGASLIPASWRRTGITPAGHVRGRPEYIVGAVPAASHREPGQQQGDQQQAQRQARRPRTDHPMHRD